MVVVMLMSLFLAIVGIGLWAYAHSLLTGAAGQAARYAANADVTGPDAASVRAAAIMADTFVGSVAATVRCDTLGAADVTMVQVHCTMAAPFAIPLLAEVLPDIDVTAHALRERR